MIGPDLQIGTGGRDLLDEQPGGKADEGQKDEDHGDPLEVRFLKGIFAETEGFAQEVRNDHAENDRNERRHFDNPVAPGQAPERQDFRQNPVLARAEKAALRRHEKKHADGGVERPVRGVLDPRVEVERNSSDRHDEDFGDLGPEDHMALAETVRERPAPAGENKVGNGEERRDDGGPSSSVALRFGRADQNEKDQDLLEDVVAERALKLEADQPPKAALAALGFLAGRELFLARNGLCRRTIHPACRAFLSGLTGAYHYRAARQDRNL